MLGHQQIITDMWLWLQVYKTDISYCQEVGQKMLTVGRAILGFTTVQFAKYWIYDCFAKP